VKNLPAGVLDHEKHVQRSKRDRLDAKEVRSLTRSPLGTTARGGRPATTGWLHILGDRSG
jgi:hypothetical protein